MGTRCCRARASERGGPTWLRTAGSSPVVARPTLDSSRKNAAIAASRSRSLKGSSHVRQSARPPARAT
eukprot:9119176-Alexandrium_andersonii.AAC.1